MRITIVISVWQTGHPAAISDTRMAHGSQKLACPHGTNAKPARGATRHTSQQSSEVDATDDSDAVEVVTAGTGAWLALSSLLLLLLLLSSRSCKDSVWALTEWLTACRNWRRRFLVNFSRNSQHFRIPTQPSVQPLFDLVLKLHGLAILASPSRVYVSQTDITSSKWERLTIYTARVPVGGLSTSLIPHTE